MSQLGCGVLPIPLLSGLVSSVKKKEPSKLLLQLVADKTRAQKGITQDAETQRGENPRNLK